MDAACGSSVQTRPWKGRLRRSLKTVKNRDLSVKGTSACFCGVLFTFLFFLKNQNLLVPSFSGPLIYLFIYFPQSSVIRHCWVLFLSFSSWVSAPATSWDLRMSLSIVRVKKKDCVKCMPHTCGMFPHDHGDKSETSEIKTANPRPWYALGCTACTSAV